MAVTHWCHVEVKDILKVRSDPPVLSPTRSLSLQESLLNHYPNVYLVAQNCLEAPQYFTLWLFVFLPPSFPPSLPATPPLSLFLTLRNVFVSRLPCCKPPWLATLKSGSAGQGGY